MTTGSQEKETPEPQESEVTEEAPQSSSSIAELQAAFGSILLATKSNKKTAAAPYTTYRGCSDGRLKPGLPKWTGAFKLFDFPRELRDRIYYYAVYRPRGLHYTAHVQRDYFFWSGKKNSVDIANFLCTSKQVYQEAYEILSRHNTVILGGGNTKRERYNKSLTGLLRLFPCTPARNVTRVRLGYNDQLMRISSQWGGAPSHGPRGDNTERFAKRQFPSETFIDILRDAHVLSQFFDKLRVFEACWSLQERRFLQEGTEGIERWMGKCTQKGYVVPWDGVRFKLWVWEKLGLEEQERCLNEAYRMLVKGHTNDKIEDSGRVWLEEMPEGKGREKKKGHRNGKRCT